ncbi:hypothetical protein [Paraclostridium bifermentans]|uniref:hypothetical protein n=1 Tax=Paraclostridium bifermentans TaxID=1490 RepID=UPI00241C9814|nr:hypothetical protein [Paraclostridium bifermentans]
MGEIYKSFGMKCLKCSTRKKNEFYDCVDCFSSELVCIQDRACYSCLCPRPEPYKKYKNCFRCNEKIKNGKYFLDGMVSCSYKYTLDSDFGFMIHSYKGAKMEKREWMSFPLKSLMYVFLEKHFECIENEFGEIEALVPIPGSAEALIPEEVNRILPVKKILTDNRKQGKQSEGSATREFNCTRFKVDNKEKLKSVILFDDVHTLGGTANSAAYALKQSGIKNVILFTLCTHLKSSQSEYIDKDRDYDIDECMVCGATSNI